jgi:hypothetical protein
MADDDETPDDAEPWAKTSSGDAETLAGDDDNDDDE